MATVGDGRQRSAAVVLGVLYQRDVLARRLSVRGLSQEYAPRDIQYLTRKNERRNFTKGVVQSNVRAKIGGIKNKSVRASLLGVGLVVFTGRRHRVGLGLWGNNV